MTHNNNNNIHLPIIGHSHLIGNDTDELKTKINDIIDGIRIEFINANLPKLDCYLAETEDHDLHICSIRYGLNAKVNFLHDHCFTLVIIFSGEHCTIHNRTNQKIHDSVFLIPPHSEVSADISGDNSNLILRFQPNPFHSMLFRNWIFNPFPKEIQVAIKHQAMQYIRSHFFIDSIEKDKALILDLKNNLYEILLNNDKTSLLFMSNTSKSVADPILDFFKHNLDWEYNIQDLSQYILLPERTLYWQFKKETNTTPYRCYTNIKLLRSRLDLIKLGKNISISQIASLNNFSHLSRFSDKYKNYFGELPRETVFRLSN